MESKEEMLKKLGLKTMFNISDEEAKYVEGDPPSGQGLLVFGSDKIPFSNRISTDSFIYKINNTDNQSQVR